MKDYKTIMDEELRLRLESDSWNFSMAGRVLKEREARRDKSIFRGYIASLAAASVFLMLFIFNVYSYVSTPAYTESYSSELYSYSSDSYSGTTEEVDLIINEVFPMR